MEPVSARSFCLLPAIQRFSRRPLVSRQWTRVDTQRTGQNWAHIMVGWFTPLTTTSSRLLSLWPPYGDWNKWKLRQYTVACGIDIFGTIRGWLDTWRITCQKQKTRPGRPDLDPRRSSGQTWDGTPTCRATGQHPGNVRSR